MHVSNFDAAFATIVGVEGGYVNDPNDPGGETNFGISKRAYPDEDIRALTLERAKELYRRDYWDRLNCEALPWDRALLIFDAAVNQGQSYAGKLPSTDVDIAVERALRYADNHNFQRYGRGWLRRLFTTFKAAQKEPA